MKGDRQLYLPTVLLVLLGLLSGSCFLTAANGEDDHLRRLFESLDRDHDGQLMRQELKQYIGSLAPEYSSSTKLDQAVEAAIGRLDSPDVGFGVSWKELEHHLHTLLQVRGSMRPLTSCGCVGSICSISIAAVVPACTGNAMVVVLSWSFTCMSTVLQQAGCLLLMSHSCTTTTIQQQAVLASRASKRARDASGGGGGGKGSSGGSSGG